MQIKWCISILPTGCGSLKNSACGWWSEVQHQAQGSEAKKPRMLCTYAGKEAYHWGGVGHHGLAEKAECVDPPTYDRFDFPPCEYKDKSEVAEESKNKIPTL